MLIFLDTNFISTLRVPDGKKRITISDKACPGLSIEMRNPGGLSWRMRYSYQKEQRCLTLGKGSQLSLDDARNLVYQLKKLLLVNQDPADSLRALKPGRTPVFLDFIHKNYLPFIASYKRCISADKSLLDNHLIPAFGKIPMNQITRYMVVEFLQLKVQQGYKPGYCNRFLVLLSYCFSLAEKWGIPEINHNPVKGVSLLKNPRRSERFLKTSELDGLVSAIQESPNPLLQFFVPFALFTGARKREILDAKWSDINFREQIWQIPMTKSGKPLVVPLTDQAIQLLIRLKEQLPNILQEEYRNSNDWVFPNPKTGKPFKSIFNAWNTARIKAGLRDLRIHDLRHSFASSLVNQGVPIYDVQKLLGHQSIKTTERYSHLSQDRLRSSSNIASQFYTSLIPKSIKVTV